MEKSKKPDTTAVLTESGLNIAGGLGGVIVGSALGTWPSLLAGMATTLTGAYYNKNWLMTSGVAMVTSIAPRLKKQHEVAGFKDEVSNAKDRVVDTLKMLGRKVMLHKVSPQMARTMELNGAEDTLLLEDSDFGAAEFDTSEVDDIIRQLEEGNAEMISGSAPVDGYLEGLVDTADIDDLSLSATA